MKIRHSLLLTFGIILIVSMVSGTVLFGIAESVSRYHERELFAQSQLKTLKDIEISLARTMKAVSDLLVSPDSGRMKIYQAERSVLHQKLETLSDLVMDEIEFVDDDEKDEEEDEVEVLETVVERSGELIGISDVLVNAVINQVSRGESDERVAALRNELMLKYDDGLKELLHDQVLDEEGEIQAVEAQVLKRVLLLKIAVVFILSLILIVLGLGAVKIWRDIYRPVESLADAMEHISDGRFDITFPRKRKNEIGDLMQGLEDMAGELRSVQGQLLQSAKLASLGQLAAGIAHELNQPLMVIRMNAQMLSKSGGNPGEDGGMLAMIVRNTQRMGHIIDHLKHFARQTDTAHETLDPAVLIKDALSLLNQQLKLKGIRVDIRAPKPPVTIRGSWNQLEQVLVNLITNARDAVLDNGPDKDKSILIAAEPDASGRHLD
ncbi:MAG: HAMP domain-containing protein, partial [Desulfobacterales bacterium]|nr:HAMP domain-containing protein [Desulfobacterales bacterium]